MEAIFIMIMAPEQILGRSALLATNVQIAHEILRYLSWWGCTGGGISPEGERATRNQRVVVLRPVGDGMKRLAHDADLKGVVVIRSPPPQLVPFKLHRFGQQRPSKPVTTTAASTRSRQSMRTVLIAWNVVRMA